MRKIGKRALSGLGAALLAAAFSLSAFAATTPTFGTAATKAADWERTTGSGWEGTAGGVADGTDGAGAAITMAGTGTATSFHYLSAVSGDFTLQFTINFDQDYDWTTNANGEYCVYMGLNDGNGDVMNWALHTNPDNFFGQRVQVWDNTKGNWTDYLSCNFVKPDNIGFSVTLVATHKAGTATMTFAAYVPGDSSPFVVNDITFTKIFTADEFNTGLTWTVQNAQGANNCVYSDMRISNTYTDEATLNPPTTAAPTTLATTTAGGAGAATTAASGGSQNSTNGIQTWVWIVIGAAVVIVAGGAIAFAATRKKKAPGDSK
ncbi:MAG: hypothetical protein FWF49_06515 [Oscillospiraceae bacterium]|nr:hypothetical protein [Oscillospiraceae bacterium]